MRDVSSAHQKHRETAKGPSGPVRSFFFSYASSKDCARVTGPVRCRRRAVGAEPIPRRRRILAHQIDGRPLEPTACAPRTLALHGAPAERLPPSMAGAAAASLGGGGLVVAQRDAQLVGMAPMVKALPIGCEWSAVTRLAGTEPFGAHLACPASASFGAGVLHHLGTLGGTREYENPHIAKLVVAAFIRRERRA